MTVGGSFPESQTLLMIVLMIHLYVARMTCPACVMTKRLLLIMIDCAD